MRVLLVARWMAPVFAVLAVGLSARTADDGWIDLMANPFDAFNNPSKEWEVVGEVGLNPENAKRLSGKPGKGIIYNGPKGTTRDLITKQKFGDVEVHLEFMIPQRSNSGIKLEGLYEIQIYDSHGKKEAAATDCGGIYPRAELKPKYMHIDKGFPPRTNAAKPAGEWQTLDIIFLAPRFDESGKKTANAKFVKVVLNGQVVHENQEVPYPTGHAWHDKEVPTGPILLQADHGPIAFKSVKVREYKEKK
jgi:3-keto-disaccharide hydrolase